MVHIASLVPFFLMFIVYYKLNLTGIFTICPVWNESTSDESCSIGLLKNIVKANQQFLIWWDYKLSNQEVQYQTCFLSSVNVTVSLQNRPFIRAFHMVAQLSFFQIIQGIYNTFAKHKNGLSCNFFQKPYVIYIYIYIYIYIFQWRAVWLNSKLAVGLNQSHCKKQMLGCLVYSLPQDPNTLIKWKLELGWPFIY